MAGGERGGGRGDWGAGQLGMGRRRRRDNIQGKLKRARLRCVNGDSLRCGKVCHVELEAFNGTVATRTGEGDYAPKRRRRCFRKIAL